MATRARPSQHKERGHEQGHAREQEQVQQQPYKSPLLSAPLPSLPRLVPLTRLVFCLLFCSVPGCCAFLQRPGALCVSTPSRGVVHFYSVPGCCAFLQRPGVSCVSTASRGVAPLPADRSGVLSLRLAGRASFPRGVFPSRLTGRVSSLSRAFKDLCTTAFLQRSIPAALMPLSL